MAIKNTDLGGTDWSDGEVLDAADLNDTFDAVVFTRQKETLTTPLTHTGDTNYTNKANFTLDVGSGVLIVGLLVKGTIATDGGGGVIGYLRVEITGTNLGSYYCYGKAYLSGNNGYAQWFRTSAVDLAQIDSSSSEVYFSTNPMLETEDATTTVNVYLKTNNAGNTTTLTGGEVQLLYLNNWAGD